MAQPTALIVGINSFLAQALYHKIKSTCAVTGVYHTRQDRIADRFQLRVIASTDLEQLQDEYFDYVFIISAYIPARAKKLNHTALIAANLQLPEKVHQLFPKARLLFCSSVSVYENQPQGQLITDTTTPSPFSAYALSKLWGEHIVAQHNSFGILRISSLYGPGMNATTFIPKICESAIQTKEINLFGKGERLQNYIYVDDAAELLWRLAQRNSNATLLAVSPKNYSNTEVAEAILKTTPGKITYIGADKSKSYCYHTQKMAPLLGEINYTSLTEGLKTVVEWIKKQS